MNSFEAELQLRPKEVRGKYSRPVVTVNGTLQLLDTTTGPLTRRPVTSGSLVSSRRSSLKTPDAKQAALPVVDTPRSHQRTRSLVYSSRRKTETCEPKEEAKVQVPPTTPNPSTVEPAPPSDPNNPLVDQAEIAPEDAETNSEANDALVEAAEDHSTASWVTSKSQQVYIAELEQLLRLERKKRLAAEQKLAEQTN